MMKILVPEKEKYRLHSRIERGKYNILAIDRDIAQKVSAKQVSSVELAKNEISIGDTHYPQVSKAIRISLATYEYIRVHLLSVTTVKL